MGAYGREQKVGQAVDRDAIFFLRPWKIGIVGPKSRLDMRQCDVELAGRKRSAERAGGVALDDHQLRPGRRQNPLHGCAYQFGVQHRIRLSRTSERNDWEAAQPMFRQLKARMLARDEQPRGLARLGEGVGDRA